jgi:hypothetical protein
MSNVIYKTENANTPESVRTEVKRITADFSPDAYETLERVAKNLDTTKADAIRRALGLIDYILAEQKQDWILVLEKDDRRREIITR